ncbi:DUF4097 family beta strand repeat-containing protein [Granulicella sp. dw_53]|uniref:DUF4097 family beta strand repeat-containing protein n=1 Tax=Granulicella sp. dw_53 TaxID=2719792 RepID=UPI001BD5DF81|nr:DUF4097 family beta strand repeat-containing protein [Granulicella sp. dw_53]
MAGYPPPYPPPPPGPPYGPDWKYQRRVLRDQARAQRDIVRAQRDAYRAHLRGMRRGSIVGPLLVVAAGVVFLLIQLGHLSFYRFGFWFGHFWPLLLVAIGVVLLIEWVFDRNAQRASQQNGNAPYIRHNVGGGVITLLVLIVVAGIAFNGYNDAGRNFLAHGFSINQDNIDQFLGDKHESDQTLDQAFPANTMLNISNPRGDVTVSGTSDDNQIHVTVHKEVYTRSDSDADSRARELNPQINTTPNGSFGSSLNLTVPSLEGTHADLTVTVPLVSPVTIMANHGDVHVNSIKAPVNVTANHGDVELSAIGGAVTTRINNGGSSFAAHSVTGDITLEGRGRDLTLSDIGGAVNLRGEFFGTTRLERIRSVVKFHTSRTDLQLARLDGEVEIANNSDLSASEAVGPVTLITRNRNITLDRISGDLSVTNRNGSVELTSAPPLGNVTIENRSGSVNLTVPEHANFTVQAETTNGDIENDYSFPTEENKSHKKFAGTVGKGGSLIRISTSEGDIAFKKANLSPLPPAPPAPPASNRFNITSEDGSSVYIGKDGVKIISGADGSKVIVGKDGLNIKAGSDGSSVYRGADDTRLVEGADGSTTYSSPSGTKLSKRADGSIAYTGSDGTHYSKGADGSVVYAGSNGTRIAIGADGSQTAIGSGGRTLSDKQVRDELHNAEQDIRKTEQQIDKVRRLRDTERNRKNPGKDNDN